MKQEELARTIAREDAQRQELTKQMEHARKHLRVCEEAVAALDGSTGNNQTVSAFGGEALPAAFGTQSFGSGASFVGGDYDRDPLRLCPSLRPVPQPGWLPDGPLPPGSVPGGARFDPVGLFQGQQPHPRGPDDPGLP
jgi:hypothetical protein